MTVDKIFNLKVYTRIKRYLLQTFVLYWKGITAFSRVQMNPRHLLSVFPCKMTKRNKIRNEPKERKMQQSRRDQIVDSGSGRRMAISFLVSRLIPREGFSITTNGKEGGGRGGWRGRRSPVTCDPLAKLPISGEFPAQAKCGSKGRNPS